MYIYKERKIDLILLPCVHYPDFSGLEVCSAVVFNPEQQSLVALKDDDGSELKGPVVRPACS